ncbi:hypothetical protein Hsar01_01807 [Haloferula sargassicola]|uniref:Uncharacterized protein n=2 Tax=Haloferula sargassicola TaxID=490096 RepID=A0ABP9UTA1_9BACT
MLLVAGILMFGTLAADALSFYNPWAVEITFHGKKGEQIIPAMNRMREAAGVQLQKQALGDLMHSQSRITTAQGSGLEGALVFTEDYRVEGDYGVLLTDLLYAYGCVGSLDFDEDTNRYDFTVSRKTPDCRCTVFLELPDSWRTQILETDFNQLLVDRAFEPERFDECILSKSKTFILLRGSPADCDRMWFLVRESFRRDRQAKTSELSTKEGQPQR